MGGYEDELSLIVTGYALERRVKVCVDRVPGKAPVPVGKEGGIGRPSVGGALVCTH